MINKQHFPIFRIEETWNGLLMTKQLCNQGIEEGYKIMAVLANEHSNALSYEMDEIERDINITLSHITFCLDSLDNVNSGLNHLKMFFN